jgi:hypothetical protein
LSRLEEKSIASHQVFDAGSIDREFLQLQSEVRVGGGPVDGVLEELASHFDQLDGTDALRKSDEVKQTLPNVFDATAECKRRQMVTVGLLKVFVKYVKYTFGFVGNKTVKDSNLSSQIGIK